MCNQVEKVSSVKMKHHVANFSDEPEEKLTVAKEICLDSMALAEFSDYLVTLAQKKLFSVVIQEENKAEVCTSEPKRNFPPLFGALNESMSTIKRNMRIVEVLLIKAEL